MRTQLPLAKHGKRMKNSKGNRKKSVAGCLFPNNFLGCHDGRRRWTWEEVIKYCHGRKCPKFHSTMQPLEWVGRHSHIEFQEAAPHDVRTPIYKPNQLYLLLVTPELHRTATYKLWPLYLQHSPRCTVLYVHTWKESWIQKAAMLEVPGSEECDWTILINSFSSPLPHSIPFLLPSFFLSPFPPTPFFLVVFFICESYVNIL